MKESIEKELYLSPECEEVAIRLEGVIAGSTPDVPYADPLFS